MSRYKKDHDRLKKQLSSLPADTSIIDRQRIENELRLLETNELRRQAKRVGLDLDKAAGVGPWTSDAADPKITWLEDFRQPAAWEIIKEAQSAHRKERRDLLIKLAPIVISLFAFLVSVFALIVSVLTYLRPATH